MGSLSSRPSVPSTATQPQVVYVSSPATSAQTNTNTPGGTDTSSGGSSNNEGTPEQTASAARSKSLLQRERGRFGTITTSFRGLLGLAKDDGQKKTLLGE